MKTIELIPEVTVKKAIEELRDRLIAELQDNLLSIRFFGSRREGLFLPESDVDILLVVKRKDRTVTERVFVISEEIEKRYFLLNYSFSIHLYDLKTIQSLKKAGSLFIKDIESQGTVVYERETRS